MNDSHLQLNIHSATYIAVPINGPPKRVLNERNLLQSLARNRMQGNLGCQENSTYTRELDITTLQKDLDCLVDIRGVKLDTALLVVLSEAGLNYQPSGASTTTRIPTPPQSPGNYVAGDTGAATLVASSFRRINAQNIKPPAVRVSPTKSERLGRLQPNQRYLTNGYKRTINERFCWNLAWWFECRISTDLKRDYRHLESFASGLCHIPITDDGLTKIEEEFLSKPDNSLTLEAYRSLRARIIIGFACIYEHNLRGSKLNQANQTHPACKPEHNTPFKYVNMGTSQAQMLAYGSDVKKASDVYKECMKAGFIPHRDILPRVSSRVAYMPIAAAEASFPAATRQELYADLEKWYAEEQIPHDLRFIIPASYSDLSPWDVVPPSLPAEAVER